MPTFSSLGGRTFAGGDMIPDIICPKADDASNMTARAIRPSRSAGIDL